MSFTETMDQISKGFEVLGVAVLAIGLVGAGIAAASTALRSRSIEEGYVVIRNHFGRSVLLALELLVAADLIRTVAIQPTLENVAVLGIIVLIRTFLSFSLEVEIEGTWPWRRGPRRSAARKGTETGRTEHR
jgi:uncharacterized membrane protein